MEKSKNGISVKFLGLLTCGLLVMANSSEAVRSVRDLPDDIYVDCEESAYSLDGIVSPFVVTDSSGIAVAGDISETLGSGNENREYTVALFGIPVKHINVHVRDEVYLMPGGQTVGISIMCDGVMVVGTGDIRTREGSYSPAAKAGIEPGDIITAVDGQTVCSVNGLTELFGDGEPHTVTVNRDGVVKEIVVIPKKSIDGDTATLGIWARESSAGIGTLSFYVMGNLKYGVLGHSIADADTGKVIPVREGRLVLADVMDVVKGMHGTPGEIKGFFTSSSASIGEIFSNTDYGVFGVMEMPMVNELYPDGIRMAYSEEIHEGPATVLSAVDEGRVRAFDCEIAKIYREHIHDTKSMVVKITDPELLERTGGIVQGMSGSPIIQDGKLIGAVTHVFVNDPTKGYGISAERMLEAAEQMKSA